VIAAAVSRTGDTGRVKVTKGASGKWVATLDASDTPNEPYDEAVPRYLNAIDPAFERASDACESEFVKALLRVRSMQDAGWDPYETTLEAIPAINKLHNEIPKDTGWADFYTARHLILWTYGHIIEASEPYAILADMLDIANGGFYKPFRFPDKPLGGRKAQSEPLAPTRPQYVHEKLPQIEELARTAGLAAHWTRSARFGTWISGTRSSTPTTA
jgi:hypothetical protein